MENVRVEWMLRADLTHPLSLEAAVIAGQMDRRPHPESVKTLF